MADRCRGHYSSRKFIRKDRGLHRPKKSQWIYGTLQWYFCPFVGHPFSQFMKSHWKCCLWKKKMVFWDVAKCMTELYAFAVTTTCLHLKVYRSRNLSQHFIAAKGASPGLYEHGHQARCTLPSPFLFKEQRLDKLRCIVAQQLKIQLLFFS